METAHRVLEVAVESHVVVHAAAVIEASAAAAEASSAAHVVHAEIHVRVRGVEAGC